MRGKEKERKKEKRQRKGDLIHSSKYLQGPELSQDKIMGWEFTEPSPESSSNQVLQPPCLPQSAHPHQDAETSSDAGMEGRCSCVCCRHIQQQLNA